MKAISSVHQGLRSALASESTDCEVSKPSYVFDRRVYDLAWERFRQLDTAEQSRVNAFKIIVRVELQFIEPDTDSSEESADDESSAVKSVGNPSYTEDKTPDWQPRSYHHWTREESGLLKWYYDEKMAGRNTMPWKTFQEQYLPAHTVFACISKTKHIICKKKR